MTGNGLRPGSLAPVEWIAIAFPGDTIDLAVLPAIAHLADAGTVHIVDLLIVHKAADDEVTVTEFEDLDPADRAAFDAVDGDVLGLISELDIPAIAEELPGGSTALVVVWESLWAAELAAVVRGAGGALLTHDRIPRDVVEAAVAAATSREGSTT